MQEFREALKKEGNPLRLFDLLSIAKKFVNEKLWLIEETILKSAKELMEYEKEHLKQLLATLRKKHTTEILAEATPTLEVIIHQKTTEEYTPSPVSQAAPEPATQANIETLKQYLILGIKLIPVYDNGAFISTGNPRDWGTGDITEIQSLINGNGYSRNGFGRGSKIKLFRCFPMDYGLVVIDVDRHKNTNGKLEKDGLKPWREIEKKLPLNCKLAGHTCYVRTPSKGYHLYFRLEEKTELKTEIAEAIDILHTKTVNVAGSVKAGEEYRLIGSLGTIPRLPDELKKLMLKQKRREPQSIRRVSIPHNFSNGDKYISREERDAYKPFLSEYLIAKGFQVNTSGLTNCPFPEHHNNGDKIPSARVYPDHLWCYKKQRKYDIYAIARQLNGGDFKAAFADVVNILGRR
jgi:hypothetical protein